MVTAGEGCHGAGNILVDFCLVVNLGDHPCLGHCSIPGMSGDREGMMGGGGMKGREGTKGDEEEGVKGNFAAIQYTNNWLQLPSCLLI